MGIPDFQKLDKWEDTPRPKTGSILEPLLFNIFINNLLVKFA
jgi:hypothetical protein